MRKYYVEYQVAIIDETTLQPISRLYRACCESFATAKAAKACVAEYNRELHRDPINPRQALVACYVGSRI
jgi:hypothetical protein